MTGISTPRISTPRINMARINQHGRGVGRGVACGAVWRGDRVGVAAPQPERPPAPTVRRRLRATASGMCFDAH